MSTRFIPNIHRIIVPWWSSKLMCHYNAMTLVRESSWCIYVSKMYPLICPFRKSENTFIDHNKRTINSSSWAGGLSQTYGELKSLEDIASLCVIARYDTRTWVNDYNHDKHAINEKMYSLICLFKIRKKKTFVDHDKRTINEKVSHMSWRFVPNIRRIEINWRSSKLMCHYDTQ